MTEPEAGTDFVLRALLDGGYVVLTETVRDALYYVEQSGGADEVLMHILREPR